MIYHLSLTKYFTVPLSSMYSVSSTVILHAFTSSADNSFNNIVSSSHFIALVLDNNFNDNISNSHYIALVTDNIFSDTFSSSHSIAANG
jgi:hypothetical protein